jgi:heme A synthase
VGLKWDLLIVDSPTAAGRTGISRFGVFAWSVLAYNLAVVMWGAFVRATGSGAGCGANWPLCNGVALPRSPALNTVIEFIHRVSSGIALILILALLVWAFRSYSKGHPVRLGASLAVFFTFTEALIGAGLVLFEKTALDKSAARVVSLSVHLINTFLLVACIALTAWWASPAGGRLRWKNAGPAAWFIVTALVGMLLLGVSGAITALGDTLYPAKSLAEGLAADLSPAAPFLVKFRKFHPAIAIGVGSFLAFFALYEALRRTSLDLRRFAFVVCGLVLTQWGLGALDVVLLAPYWAQLTHLFLADLLWIAAVLFSASLLSCPPPQNS